MKKSNPKCLKFRKNPSKIIVGLTVVAPTEKQERLTSGIDYDDDYLQYLDDLSINIFDVDSINFVNILFENVSKILKRKLPTLFKKIPEFYITPFSKEHDESYAITNTGQNIILINFNKFYYIYILKIKSGKKDFNNSISFWTRILMHEIGHYIFDNVLDRKSVIKFEDYIKSNFRSFKFADLWKIAYSNSYDYNRLKCPVAFSIIESLVYEVGEPNTHDNQNRLVLILRKWYAKHGDKPIVTFAKPASSFMPPQMNDFDLITEIFAEIFANYMIADLKWLHSDNYKILKVVLPELRN